MFGNFLGNITIKPQIVLESSVMKKKGTRIKLVMRIIPMGVNGIEKPMVTK